MVILPDVFLTIHTHKAHIKHIKVFLCFIALYYNCWNEFVCDDDNLLVLTSLHQDRLVTTLFLDWYCFMLHTSSSFHKHISNFPLFWWRRSTGWTCIRYWTRIVLTEAASVVVVLNTLAKKMVWVFEYQIKLQMVPIFRSVIIVDIYFYLPFYMMPMLNSVF